MTHSAESPKRKKGAGWRHLEKESRPTNLPSGDKITPTIESAKKNTGRKTNSACCVVVPTSEQNRRGIPEKFVWLSGNLFLVCLMSAVRAIATTNRALL